MITFMFVLLVAFVTIAYLAWKKVTKDMLKKTKMFLLSDQPAITEQASGIHYARKKMMQNIVEQYGNDEFSEKTMKVRSSLELYMDQLTIRFDEFKLKRIIKIHDTSKEIRMIEVKKNGQMLLISILVDQKNDLVSQQFYFVPINGGLDIKDKELQSIAAASQAGAPRDTHSFFILNGEILEEMRMPWSERFRMATINPIKMRVFDDGEMKFLLIRDLYDLMVSAIFKDRKSVVLMGPGGSGKTSFIQGWLHAASSVTDPNIHKVVMLEPRQFLQFLLNEEHVLYSLIEKDKAKYTIVVDQLSPLMPQMAWDTLLSMMEGMLKEQMNLSFILAFQSGNKDHFIAQTKHLDLVSTTALRPGRVKFIGEMSSYSQKDWTLFANEIEKVMEDPYEYDKDLVRKIVGASTSLSNSGQISYAELWLGKVRKKEEAKKETKEEMPVKEDIPPKEDILEM